MFHDFLNPLSNTNECYLQFKMHITATIISMLHVVYCLKTAAVSMTSLQHIIIALFKKQGTGRSSVIRFREVRATNRIILLETCKTDENTASSLFYFHSIIYRSTIFHVYLEIIFTMSHFFQFTQIRFMISLVLRSRGHINMFCSVE